VARLAAFPKRKLRGVPDQFVSDQDEKICLKLSTPNYWCFQRVSEMLWKHLLIWDLYLKLRYSGNSVPREQKFFARNYTEDEGRSLGTGLQDQAPNHLKLLW